MILSSKETQGFYLALLSFVFVFCSPEATASVATVDASAATAALDTLANPSSDQPGSNQPAQWYSVLPPIIAISLAFLTRHLLFSLSSAVVAGAILFSIENATSNIIVASASQSFHYFYTNVFNPWNLKVLAFVICILSMISVVIVAGGLKGVVAHLLPYAKTPKSSQFITAVTGLIVFIDDYANTMIVGSSMRPITDQYHVSRSKLAFIIDATSAPVAGLAVVSTWIGFEVGLFGEVSTSLNLNLDGYSMFFDAFAFRFYCILMLIFVFVQIYFGREFGPMLAAESNPLSSEKNDHSDQKHSHIRQAEVDPNSHISAKSAIIPFTILFTVLIGGLWVDGNGMAELNKHASNIFSLSSWRRVIASTENSTTILLLSAICGLVSSILIARFFANARFNYIINAIKIGTRTSLLPVLILLLAWSLKSTCDDLHTGDYIVGLLSPHLSPLWFPAILFFIAAVTAFGTGTSWGTMSILIPISIPLAFALDGNTYGLVTIICLGAVLDGAIFGDHCSPISDTTIMSSIAAQCDHIEHVRTQVPYSLYIATIAIMAGYIPAAMATPAWVSYLLGITLLTIGLYLFGKKPNVRV